MIRILLIAIITCLCLVVSSVYAEPNARAVKKTVVPSIHTPPHDTQPPDETLPPETVEPLIQLTFTECMKEYSEWSPDGNFIIFSADMNEGEQQLLNIWRIPVEGGDPVQLTDFEAHHGVYSPDGKYIAFDGDQGSVVRVMPSDGGIPIRIVPASIPVENSGNPCWSPDGTKIAFRSNEDLMILDLPTGEITTVFHMDTFKPLPIQWSTIDNCILTALVNPQEKKGNLWKISLDGEEPQQVTFHDGYVSQGTISPDGKIIMYAANDDGNGYDLYVVSYDGGEPMKFTDVPGQTVEPCWSPDGQHVVFSSTRSGAVELWLMDVDMEQIETDLSVNDLYTETLP
jgi:Tol biopolymer transport system component